MDHIDKIYVVKSPHYEPPTVYCTLQNPKQFPASDRINVLKHLVFNAFVDFYSDKIVYF
jgi:hypothetical protein